MKTGLHSTKRSAIFPNFVRTLLLAALVPASTLGSQNASDSACGSGYSGSGDWTGNNGGTGFGPWFFKTVGGSGGGFYRGSCTNNAAHNTAGNIDTTCSGAFSWGMYAGGSTVGANLARISRTFTAGSTPTNALQVGQIFSIDFDNGFIATSGSQGFSLQNSSSNDIVQFRYIGGGSPNSYQINGTAVSPNIGFTGAGLRLRFTVASSTTCTVQISTNNWASTNTYTGVAFQNPAGGQAISQVIFFVNGSGSGSDADCFFNSMSISCPAFTVSTPANQTVCSGATAAFSASPSGAATPTYQWQFSANAGSSWQSVTNGTGGATTNYTTAATTTGMNSFLYRLAVTDACGNVSNSPSATLTVNTTPDNAGSITGSTCVSSNQTGVQYTINAVNGAASYNWTVPSGASITAGTGTTNITVTFGTASGNVTVTPVNGSCSGGQATLAVGISGVGNAGAISGPTTVCANVAGVQYSIAPVSGASSYNWTVPSDALITAGSGTTNITVTFGTNSGTVAVTPVAGSCSGGANSASITVNNVGGAGSITGSTSVTSGDTNVSYSVAAVPGASSYTWTVPSGASVATGQGTTSISVDYSCSAVSGNVQVTPITGSCSGSSASTAVTVTTVAAASAITGPTNLCAGTTGQTYSITSVSGATTYAWTVPSDATVTSGQGTVSITVDFGSSSGNVTVTPANTNGCAGTAANCAVTVNSAPATPGSISGASSVCSGSSGVAYSVTAVGGATGYTWSVPSGASITSGQGTNAIVVNWGSATSGNVSVTASNSCGTSSPATLAVTVNAAPSGAVASVSPVCQGNPAIFSVSNSGGSASGYAWRKRGTGWSTGNAWTFSNSGTGSEFLGSSVDNDNGNTPSNGGNDINTSGKAWAIFNNGGVSDAVRAFGNGLAVGQAFNLDMDNGNIQTGGTVGFGLQDAGGTNRIEFYFAGGNANYTVNDGTAHDTGIGFTRTGVNVQLRLTGTDSYTVTVTRYSDNATATLSGTLGGNAGTAIKRVRLFNANSGDCGFGCNNFTVYFNNLAAGPYDDNAANYTAWNTGDNFGNGPLADGGTITGSATASLTNSAATLGDAGSYDVLLWDACGQTLSSATSLTVNPTTVGGTVSPSTSAVCNGSGTTLTLSGQTGSVVKWQYSTDNFASDINDVANTTTNLSTGSLSVTTYYRAVLQSGVCSSANSSVAEVTVDQPPAVTGGATNQLVCESSPAVFVVSATGTSLTYQWQVSADGGVTYTNVSSTATNASYTVASASYANNGDKYLAIVTGICGSPATSAVATLMVDRPPVAPDTNAGATQSQPLLLPLAKQLMTITDPDGNTPSITSAGPTSTNGGSVVLTSTNIIYTPQSGYVGADLFTYVVSDGVACSVTRNVYITVTSSNAPSLNIVSGPSILPNDHFYVGFAGVPGFSYTIQWSSNIDTPSWTTITNITAPTNGLFDFEDPTTPRPPTRYYRTTSP